MNCCPLLFQVHSGWTDHRVFKWLPKREGGWSYLEPGRSEEELCLDNLLTPIPLAWGGGLEQCMGLGMSERWVWDWLRGDKVMVGAALGQDRADRVEQSCQ